MNYLEQAVAAVTGLFGGNAAPQAEELPQQPPVGSLDHMPRNDAALGAINVAERVMLAAGVASGGDAVAYYAFDDQKQLALRQQIDLYDLDHKHPTRFAETLDAYREGTYADEKAVRANKEYHIPVRDAQGHLQGVVVIHAPQDEEGKPHTYSRVQSEEEARKDAEEKTPANFKPDAHEPAPIRIAKLQMAQHAVEMNAQKLLTGEHTETPQERDAFLLQMAKDMFHTFPKQSELTAEEAAAIEQAKNGEELRVAVRKALYHDNADQGPHLVGTGDIMKYAAEALNEGQAKQVVSDKQAADIELLAMLHDVGKAQFSSAYWQDWKNKTPAEQMTPEEKAEQAARQVDFDGRNANHAFFTEAMLQLYPASAKTIGDHHHGHDRYSEKEIDQKLGSKKDEYVIMTDHVPEQNVSMLSRMIRYADVAESISGQGVDKPLDFALQDMAEKAGIKFKKDKDGKRTSEVESFTPQKMDPNSMDADVLAFMVEHKVLQKYGAQREAEEKDGWVVKKADKAKGVEAGTKKYDAEKLDEIGRNILEALHWNERQREVEARLRASIAVDPVLAQEQEQALPPVPHKAQMGMGR